MITVNPKLPEKEREWFYKLTGQTPPEKQENPPQEILAYEKQDNDNLLK